MDKREHLEEIIDRGAPGQAAQAEELLASLLAGQPDVAAIDLLYDAFLHDPYLTRDEPG